MKTYWINLGQPELIPYKSIKINCEAQFLINQVLKNKIEKKLIKK